MSSVLEIPPRPPWSPVPPPLPPDTRVETPMVRIEPRWEYREVVREREAGLMSTRELDAMGGDHWELAGVVAAGERVHFYFKREQRP